MESGVCVVWEQLRYGGTERHRAEPRQERRKSRGGQTSYKGFLLYDLTVPLPLLNLWREMFRIQSHRSTRNAAGRTSNITEMRNFTHSSVVLDQGGQPPRFSLATSKYFTWMFSNDVLAIFLLHFCSQSKYYLHIQIINPLNPSGYYIYHQFNVVKLCILPRECICNFRTVTCRVVRVTKITDSGSDDWIY
jgi:hypothetical protein